MFSTRGVRYGVSEERRFGILMIIEDVGQSIIVITIILIRLIISSSIHPILLEFSWQKKELKIFSLAWKNLSQYKTRFSSRTSNFFQSSYPSLSMIMMGLFPDFFDFLFHKLQLTIYPPLNSLLGISALCLPLLNISIS